jgi:DNA-binding PadR family transcriptional regulator
VFAFSVAARFAAPIVSLPLYQFARDRVITENKRRARVYEITAAGRKQLQQTEGRWRAVTAAVGQVLQRA